MTGSCPVPGSPINPHLLRVGVKCLSLHPLLRLDGPVRNKRSPINPPRAREMLLSRLLPNQQEGSLSMSPRPRLVRGLRPPPKWLQRGNPGSCWTASLCLQPPAYGCGRRVRVDVLPKRWPRVLCFPRTCMLLRRGLKNLWGAG